MICLLVIKRRTLLISNLRLLKLSKSLTEVSRYYPEKFEKEGRKITKVRTGVYLVGAREGYQKDGEKIGEASH